MEIPVNLWRIMTNWGGWADLTYEVWDFTHQRMKVVYESLTGLAGAKMEEEMSASFIIYSEQY